LEHLVFKGGESYPSHRAVNSATDRLGARLNAQTSHELVAFHIRVRAERALEAVDLLTDIVGRPRVDEEALDRERGVVIQEIARANDQPRSRVEDLSGRAAFEDHPLGWPILGTEDSLRAIGRTEVLAFRGRRWAPARGCALIVGNGSSLAGNGELEELLNRLPRASAPPPHAPPPPLEPRRVVEQRDSSQTHLVLTWRPPIEVSDPRVRAAFAVYAMLLGGSMGSRLVTEIREDRGWAYSVRAEADPLSDTAAVYVTAGLDSKHAVEAAQRAAQIVAELAAAAPTRDEVDRARSATAGRRALAFENTTTAAIHMAEEMLQHKTETDPAAAVKALDAVSFDEVAAIAAATVGQPALACVGPHDASEFGGWS
jgi:predicted Zn-dependent peptidase